MSINLKTYLTPSIPKEIFIILSNYIERKGNIKVNLIFETTSSGPKINEKIDEDVAFICSPPYYWLCDTYGNDIELLPTAPIFKDSRNNKEPLYFSDILVRKDSPISSLDDLNGHNWAYNDTESLSGFFCIKSRENLINMVCSGSHLNSIKMVSNGDADITCIDSNVLLFTKHDLKVIGTFGPHPIQPGVIKSNCKYKEKICKIFNEINNDKIFLEEIRSYKIEKFEKINKEFFFNKYSIKHLL